MQALVELSLVSYSDSTYDHGGVQQERLSRFTIQLGKTGMFVVGERTDETGKSI